MRKSIIRRFTKPPEIPTASTADVAFLLILFFMVTTVFRATSLNLKIVLPKAKSTERILIRRNITHIWVDNNGRVFIDDSLVPKERVSSKISPKIAENQELVTILNIHGDIEYGIVDVILDQLKDARAFKITFATEFGG